MCEDFLPESEYIYEAQNSIVLQKEKNTLFRFDLSGKTEQDVKKTNEVKDVNDAELLQTLQTDPERGCRCLVEQYTGTVQAVIRRKLGGVCTSEDVEELSSDILFSVWQMRERISEEKGTLRGLIVTVAGRRCIDWYRTQSSKPERHSLDTAERVIPNVALTPEDAAVSEEQKQLMLDAINTLNEVDREILLRKYYCGETAAEIAERLSMRTGTVEMRLSRAKQKLRTVMGGESDV